MTKTGKTNKDVLVKGLQTLGACLVCMFMGPTLVYISLSNKEKPFYIPILILSVIVCVLAILLLFKGINTILKSIFNPKNSADNAS